MASPKMKAFNDSIPKPSYTDTIVGSINEKKHSDRMIKRMTKGRTCKDRTKKAGAFGNIPNKSIPLGYDFNFPKEK